MSRTNQLVLEQGTLSPAADSAIVYGVNKVNVVCKTNREGLECLIEIAIVFSVGNE